MKRLFIIRLTTLAGLTALAVLVAGTGLSLAQGVNEDSPKAKKYVDKASPELMKEGGAQKPTPALHRGHIDTGIKGQRGLPDDGQPTNKQNTK
jgi:hypothetical protein